jgi:hypothetical protein
VEEEGRLKGALKSDRGSGRYSGTILSVSTIAYFKLVMCDDLSLQDSPILLHEMSES